MEIEIIKKSAINENSSQNSSGGASGGASSHHKSDSLKFEKTKPTDVKRNLSSLTMEANKEKMERKDLT